MKIPGGFSTSTAPTAPYKIPTADRSRFALGLELKGFRWLILLTLISVAVTAQDAKRGSGNNSRHAQRASTPPINDAGIRYASNRRRDPFENPLQPEKKAIQDDEVPARKLPPPGIAGTPVAKLLFKGTSFREERQLAIVCGTDKRIYFLEKGARLLDGYLKTIQKDSIILVRETKLRSGKILTQDVTKLLRKP